MQVTEKSVKGLKYEYTVVVGAADMDQRMTEQLQKLSHQVRMPGFRPGKAPLSLLKKLHGKNLLGQILEETVNESSRQLLEERKVRPALQPQIEVIKFDEGTDLEYTLTVEIIPEIAAPDFSTLKLEKLVVKATDAEVQESLQRLADQQKSFETAAKTHKAALGDAVLIDFLGKIDGVPFDGGAAEDYQLELGSGSFIPGFEDGLIGVKAGDKRDVKVAFPENYGAKPLAGKDAVFEVTVKEVKKPVAVKIDDELATRVGLENLEALKKAIRDQIEQDYASMSRTRLKRSLLDALAEAHSFEVPAGMVDMEFEQIWAQLKQDIERSTDEDEKEELGEEAEQEYRSIAERRVRLGLLLSEVGTINNIVIRQEEVNRLIAQEARQFPGQEKMVFEFYQKNPQALAQLRAPLYEDKVVDFIIELAKVSEKEVSREALRKAIEEDEGETAAKPEKKKAAPKKAKAEKVIEAAAEEPAKAEKPKKAPAKKPAAKKD